MVPSAQHFCVVTNLQTYLLTQIFEWWYFRKYGTSFIEQVSLNHLSPWLGGGDNASNDANGNGTGPGGGGGGTGNGSISSSSSGGLLGNAQSAVPGDFFVQ
jgi:hypothetical protein